MRSSFFSLIRNIELLYGVSSREALTVSHFVSSSTLEDDRKCAVLAAAWLRRPVYICQGFCQCSFLGISHFIIIIFFFFTPGIPVCGIAITVAFG